MKVAIMQPYFLPYIGYYQLISAVDTFVIYDNIQYCKKGWINRNRMLQNEKDVLFSLPLKKDSDYLDIRKRELSDTFNRTKMLNQMDGSYRRAPYFEQTFPVIKQCIQCNEINLFLFLLNSLVKTSDYLGINTKIIVSSDIAIDHSLRSQDKVIALCDALGANTYINLIGGSELYSKHDFIEKSIDLKFIKSKPIQYKQFNDSFVPWLSIIDVMMFNTAKDIWLNLKKYELL